MQEHCGRYIQNEMGIVIVYVAILMVVFLGFVALAIDVGFMMVARTELQRTADAAALAGARQLGALYEGMDYQTQAAYDVSDHADHIDQIKGAATGVAALNRSAGEFLVVDPADVTIGRWDPESTPHFTDTTARANAVRVVARRDDSATSIGPINTFFARVLGIDNVNVSTPATAALTGQTTMVEGGLPVPLAISENNTCDQKIQLHPTKDSCAGWHAFFDNANANTIAEILESQVFPESLRKKKFEKSDPFVSPPVNAYETDDDLQPHFIGGDLASNFDSFILLFDYMKDKDGDNNDDVWTTSVIVYRDSSPCSNPTGTKEVVGFADFEISAVVGPSVKTFYGTLKCGFVQPGRGGGGNPGTSLGSIPGLVE